MAQLNPGIPYGLEDREGENPVRAEARKTAAFAAIEAASASLHPDTLVGGILDFPVEGGHAKYLVVHGRPLQLQHIPYADNLEAPLSVISRLNWQNARILLKVERDQVAAAKARQAH